MEEKKKELLLPASVLIAGILISVAVIYSTGKKSLVADNPSDIDQAANILDAATPANLRPVSADDHLFGKPESRLKIVEFSDLECPFCKDFHLVLKQAVSNYDGKLAWVYRHFPLEGLHPKALKEAEATECAAELGGNDAFWKYIDKIFDVTPSNNGLDLNLLPKIASDIGLDEKKFKTCLDSGRYAEKINVQTADAEAAGGRGTPYSVIIDEKNDKKIVIPGALPFEGVQSLKAVIDKLLEN